MDRGAWWAAVHGVTKSWTRLSYFTLLFTFMHWRRKWQPTPVFLPGESQGQGSLVGCRLWGHAELDTTEATQQQQQTVVEVMKTLVTSFERSRACTVHLVPPAYSRPPPTHTSAEDAWTLTGKSGSVSCGVTAPFSWVLVQTRFCLCPPRHAS